MIEKKILCLVCLALVPLSEIKAEGPAWQEKLSIKGVSAQQVRVTVRIPRQMILRAKVASLPFGSVSAANLPIHPSISPPVTHVCSSAFFSGSTCVSNSDYQQPVTMVDL